MTEVVSSAGDVILKGGGERVLRVHAHSLHTLANSLSLNVAFLAHCPPNPAWLYVDNQSERGVKLELWREGKRLLKKELAGKAKLEEDFRW